MNRNRQDQGNDSGRGHSGLNQSGNSGKKPGLGQDARAEIRVSEDGMEAVADFLPPRGSGQALSRDYLYNQLALFDVLKGYDEEAISKALDECNLERKTLRGVRIASGKQAVPEVASYISIDPRYLDSSPKLEKQAVKVDFKEVSPFIIVREGEKLGSVIEDRAGEEGYDVRGTPLPFGKTQGTAYALGERVRQEGSEILADADGRFVLSGNRLSVEVLLEIRDKVDYHTGNISFPRDIVIGKGIEPGFKVYSGASILCKSTIDATDINAKQDLVVQGGIVGRHEARVRVGGRLEARFVENCRVVVRENAYVEKAILNSRFYTLGRLELGEKGRIVGSEVWALKGLKAASLGSAAGSPVTVNCGIDFTIKQKVDFIKERLRVLVAKSFKAETMAKIKTSPALEAIRREIQAMQEQLLASLTDLEPLVDADPSATVEIRGEIRPGVTISICRCSMTVGDTIKGMRLSADPANGRIVCENLK